MTSRSTTTNANEGETRGPASEGTEPHHALDTPVEAIDEGDQAVVGTEEDEGEKLENADERAESEKGSCRQAKQVVCGSRKRRVCRHFTAIVAERRQHRTSSTT